MHKNNFFIERLGVGAVIINNQQQLFLGQRIDVPINKRGIFLENCGWQMPQGGIDPHETPAEAVLREVEEEIGTEKIEIIKESREWFRYELPPEIRSKVWDGQFQYQKQKWFLLRFLGKDKDIRLETNHQEFIDWRWASFKEAIHLIVPFKKKLYEDVFLLFSDYLD